ncbi:MAG: NirD/YgiW/YdeI family stress tolerance protein [Rhizobiaceae bacterium]|nr:NirD/YgiW/YdeI family stress tolerance protein [Rhizobiaceae bacterium]
MHLPSRPSARPLALKLSLAALCAAFLLQAPAAQAQFTESNNPRVVTTVEQAHRARIGRDVSLTGHIKSQIRRDQYLFRDKTGEIRVEIDREVWRGRNVTPNTRVRLTGDVELDIRGRHISVERLRILE